MSQDGVVLHCQHTARLPWADLAASWPPANACADGPSLASLHQAYAERFDSFRDPQRGERIKAAIQGVAERAAAGERLSWKGLCAVQAQVLGCASVGFRQQEAFTNARMVRFGFDPRLEGALSKKLERDDAQTLHPLLKACRAYLDVRFFHPFADGNSAAARLAFQWVLESERVTLKALTPVFRLPIAPGSEANYQALLDLAAAQLPG